MPYLHAAPMLLPAPCESGIAALLHFEPEKRVGTGLRARWCELTTFCATSNRRAYESRPDFRRPRADGEICRSSCRSSYGAG